MKEDLEHQDHLEHHSEDHSISNPPSISTFFGSELEAEEYDLYFSDEK